MLDNLIFSINNTFPLFLVVLVGWFLRKRGLFTAEFIRVADKYVFRVALPCALFADISTMDIYRDFDIRFVVFCALATAFMFGFCYLVARLFLRERPSVGAFAQGSARGSAAILGIALAEMIYGNAGAVPMMIVAAVPFYNVYSVIILSVCGEETEAADPSRGKRGSTVKRTLMGIVTNPIIIGIFLGIPFALLKIQLPVIVTGAVDKLAITATPVALLVIGASFDGRQALSKLKPALWASLIKLVLLPAVILTAAYFLGFRQSEMTAILIMAGAPTTVASYIMAKNMKNDEALASDIVLITTLLSVLTLTLWVFVLRQVGAL